MNRRNFLIGVGALTAVAAPMFKSAIAQDAPMKIAAGINTVGVPFAYQENNAFKGVMYEMLEAIAATKGFTVDYSPMKFAAMIPALQVNQIDVGVTGFFVTEERRKVIDFSTPIYKQGSLVVVPADSPITSIEGLRGKVIAAQQGSAPLAVAQKHAEEWGVEVRILADGANMRLAMQAGDVAGLIYDSAVVRAQLKVEADRPTQKVVSDLLEPTDIAYGVPKGSEFLAVLNEGLAELKKSGQLEAIKKKYDL